VRHPAICAALVGSAVCACTAPESLAAADKSPARPVISVPTCTAAPAHPLKKEIGPALVAFDASPFP
jgi:hypothetical protein